MSATKPSLTEQAPGQPPNGPFQGQTAAESSLAASLVPPPGGPGTRQQLGAASKATFPTDSGWEIAGKNIKQRRVEKSLAQEGSQMETSTERKRSYSDRGTPQRKAAPSRTAKLRKTVNTSLREGTKIAQDRKQDKLTPIIIDGVPAANQLQLSKELSRAVPGIRVRRLNRLARGGVLVVPVSVEEGSKLLAACGKWAGDSFWGNARAHYAGQSVSSKDKAKEDQAEEKHRVVAYGIDHSLTDAVLLEELSDLAPLCVKRLSKTDTPRAAPVLIELASADAAASALKHGIFLGCMHFKCRAFEQKRIPVRCYKCQAFGHVASACTVEERCPRCGGPHARSECPKQAEPACCVNCKGEHSSAWKGCPAFKAAAQQLAPRRKSYAHAASGQPTAKPQEEATLKSSEELDRLKAQIVDFITAVMVACHSVSSNSDICKSVSDAAYGFFGVQIDGGDLFTNLKTTRKQEEGEERTKCL